MKTNTKNKNKAWKYFEQHGYADHNGMILHHTDINMKTENPTRYNEWRPEDLIPMTKTAHRALHMRQQNKKGTYHNSDNHNIKISESMKKTDIKSKKIIIHRPAVEEVTMTFDSLADAARFIGCSRQLISQCLRPGSKNKKAYGYIITAV